MSNFNHILLYPNLNLNHFLNFITRSEKRELPVLWFQCFLTFSQRYKQDISSEQKQALLDLCKVMLGHLKGMFYHLGNFSIQYLVDFLIAFFKLLLFLLKFRPNCFLLFLNYLIILLNVLLQQCKTIKMFCALFLFVS